MVCRWPRNLAGWTLVELLVCVAIVSLMVGLLLPTLVQTREAARRLHCATNLRSWGQALQGFVAFSGEYPPAATVGGAPAQDGGIPRVGRHSLFTFLLPFVDQAALASQVVLGQDWNKGVNFTWCRQDLGGVFICPSAPDGRHRFHATDYTTMVRVDPSNGSGLGPLIAQSLLQNRSRERSPRWGSGRPEWRGLLRTVDVNHWGRSVGQAGDPSGVSDGLSKTVFLIENGGKPYCYRHRRRAQCRITRFRWASPSIWMTLNDWCGDRLLLNCHNNSQPYSFHPGGLNLAFADGSVKWLAEDVNPDQFVSLITAEGGD